MNDRERRGLVQRLARTAANLVYRDIDLQQPPHLRLDGPVLAVSNHFGGLADAVLIIDALPTMPRVVARDVIWRIPVVGSVASAVGMIPVHRRADGGPGSNDEMFAETYAVLGEGSLVLIFPEGVTQDVPHMAQVRSGAARIALGARAGGVRGLRILPIGIHYEDKAGFRTRALVHLGEPIDLDAWVGADRAVGGADDREAVRDLTATIDAALRAVAPDFPDWPTANALRTAAQVLLDDVEPVPDPAVQYGDLEVVAARLNRTPEPGRTELVAAAARYRTALQQAGTSDRRVALAGGQDRRGWRWVLDLLVLLLLLPYALAGVLVAALPLLAVLVTSRLRVAPAVRATLVPAVALLTFLAVWLLFGWQSLRADGWDVGVLAVLLFPFFLGALFVVAEWVQLRLRRWRHRRRPQGSVLAALQAQRAEVAVRGWTAL
jgi:glycerol-3-phosphate O-acyltransferase / dihydroxyacetone phosphate acyltransferase